MAEYLGEDWDEYVGKAQGEVISYILSDYIVNPNEELNQQMNSSFRRYVANIYRDRTIKLRDVHLYSDDKFKKMFRLPREAFNILLEKISPYISPSGFPFHSPQRQNLVSAEIRLLVTLRFLAGGSYHDIGGMFGIAKNGL